MAKDKPLYMRLYFDAAYHETATGHVPDRPKQAAADHAGIRDSAAAGQVR
jgi:hypothetical protein